MTSTESNESNESTKTAAGPENTKPAESTTALLVIDVQESFRQRDSWQAASDPEVAVQVARLVGFAREQGHLVVWVLHSEAGSGTVFDPALGHVRLIEGLVAADGEPVLTKTSHNAFPTTHLPQLLPAHRIPSLTT